MKKILAIAAVVALLAVACGGDDSDDAATGGDNGGGEAAAASSTVTAANFAFDPPELSVASGDSIEFVNEDDTQHSFTIEGEDVDETVDGGGSADITIDLDAGDYDFLCKFHEAMTGTLTVT